MYSTLYTLFITKLVGIVRLKFIHAVGVNVWGTVIRKMCVTHVLTNKHRGIYCFGRGQICYVKATANLVLSKVHVCALPNSNEN